MRQAAEYGIYLLAENEKLELQNSSQKIQWETEVEELTVERDAFKRRNDRYLLEIESWKRKLARMEDDKYELGLEFEQFVAHCECRNGRAEERMETIRQLNDQVSVLRASLSLAESHEQMNALTISSLQQWKRDAEYQQQEAKDAEIVQGDSDQSYVAIIEEECSRLHAMLAQKNAQITALADSTKELEDAMKKLKKELQTTQDELTEKRLECSEQTELVHSAESKCMRLQRELTLMEHVSYLSLAVIDNDTEEDEDDDEPVVVRAKKETPSETETNAVEMTVDDFCSGQKTPAAQRKEERRDSVYTPFPTTTTAENGAQVPVTPSVLETHKKLHHYFHLTASSIIHENDLHEKCFNSSSRFTIDTWYREIVASDVPFLEWHAWLINRIGQVAASVQNEDATPKSGARSFFMKSMAPRDRQGSAGSVPSPGTTPGTTPGGTPKQSPVSFSVARAFFRLLRKQSAPIADIDGDER